MTYRTPKASSQPALRQPLWLRLLGLAALALLGVGVTLALFVSPADVNQGNLIRIMYTPDWLWSRL